jgi:hypothetical protein
VARAGRQLGAPQQSLQQHRVGRCERRAEDRAGRQRQIEQEPRRPANSAAESSVPGPVASSASARCSRASRRSSESASVNRIRRERERRGDLQRGRIELDVEQLEAGGSERGAEREEDRDLRHAAALDQAREERRDQDHGADQCERAGELGGRETRHGGSA